MLRDFFQNEAHSKRAEAVLTPPRLDFGIKASLRKPWDVLQVALEALR